ncbi:MAG TPA: YebC/PmpR family DNA-binding transcriptional regulator [Solirubrobacterales bacterium]|nr:YebC/PmpR family DNA-binding transcriptional regulator [Solirubrobacterales bacterium]
MSGHSKWSSIKHKKAVTDAKRGKLFTKLARAVTIAARDGGGDAEANPALGLAIQKAREASMPKDNIQRAIERGTGEGSDAAAIEQVQYEGYGPGGVAILVDTLTDNRNRTGAEMRHAFERAGGSLGEPGSVAWQFDKRGSLALDAERYDEDDVMPAIDAGADDVMVDGTLLEVMAPPPALTTVREALESGGIEVESAAVQMRPKTTVEVDERDAAAVLRLIEALDDHDDVDQVYANFEIADEVLAALEDT